MKILFSHFGAYKKGGWGRTFSLANGLAAIGNEVILFTTNPSISLLIKKERINGVLVYIFPDIIPYKLTSKGYGFLSLLLKLIYVSFMKFTIVHSDSGHRPSSGWPCLLNKWIHSSIYIAEWWDYFGYGGQLDQKPYLYRKWFGWFESRSEIFDKKMADGIVVLSEYMKERAINLGICNKKIKILHGGCDVFNINKSKSIKSKSAHGVAENILTFGYVGISDSEIIDLEPFIKSLKKFSSSVRFVTFGRYLSDIIINKYCLEDILLEMGWLDFSHDSNKLGIVDVFVLIKKVTPINIAGWPNKLGDYLACGRPVLMNPYGDLVDFVNKHPEAFIIVDWDQEIIEKKIAEILASRYILGEMGDYARKIAENELSWESKSVELDQFYEVISARKNQTMVSIN